MRRTIVAVLAALGLIFAGISAASATDYGVNPTVTVDTTSCDGDVCANTSPTSFALAADIPGTSARARVDFTGFDVSQGYRKVDASDIYYRSLNTSNQQASWEPDRIQVQVLDTQCNPDHFYWAWFVWTAQGGGLGDGITVPPQHHWDPGAKYNVAQCFQKVRLSVRTQGGIQAYSPEVAIS